MWNPKIAEAQTLCYSIIRFKFPRLDYPGIGKGVALVSMADAMKSSCNRFGVLSDPVRADVFDLLFLGLSDPSILQAAISSSFPPATAPGALVATLARSYPPRARCSPLAFCLSVRTV